MKLSLMLTCQLLSVCLDSRPIDQFPSTPSRIHLLMNPSLYQRGGSRNILHADYSRTICCTRTTTINSLTPQLLGVPHLLTDLSCHADHVHQTHESIDPQPVFCVRYHPSPTAAENLRLVTADEDGWINFFSPTQSSSSQPIITRHRFQAHQNAIYDIQWTQSSALQHSGAPTMDEGVTGTSSDILLTVSGDQTACAWDIQTGTQLVCLDGHVGSVKCIRTQPGQPAVIVTGARDGKVLLYDLREPHPSTLRENTFRARNILQQVHVPITAASSKIKRKRAANSKTVVLNDPHPGVTAMAFLQPHLLLTGGAADSDIRAWDLRTMRTRFKKDTTIVASMKEIAASYSSSPTSSSSSAAASRKKKALSSDTFEPVWQISPPSATASERDEYPQRRYGITSFALDSTGQRLLVGSRDHVIRLYDFVAGGSATHEPSSTPVQLFTGHSTLTFDVKASWSPCGRFIASGSSDHAVYIWDAHAYKTGTPTVDPAFTPNETRPVFGVPPLKILTGHAGETSDVSWNPHVNLSSSSTPFQLASGSDDSTVRIWNVDRSLRYQGAGDIIVPQVGPIEPDTVDSVEMISSFPIAFSPTSPSPNSHFGVQMSYASTVVSTTSSLSTSSFLFDPLLSMASTSTTTSSSTSFAQPDFSRLNQLLRATPSPTSTSSSGGDDQTMMEEDKCEVRERSLSPANRRMTSSSRTHMDNTTSSLELQLTTQLTVSPTRVQLARDTHSQCRQRHRQLMSDAEEAKNEETKSNERSFIRRLAPSAVRMLAIPGATLPTFRPDGIISPVPSTPNSASSPTSTLLQTLPIMSFRSPLSFTSQPPAYDAFAPSPIASSPMTPSTSSTTSTPLTSPSSTNLHLTPTPTNLTTKRIKVIPIRRRMTAGTKSKSVIQIRPIKDFFQTIQPPNQFTQSTTTNHPVRVESS